MAGRGLVLIMKEVKIAASQAVQLRWADNRLRDRRWRRRGKYLLTGARTTLGEGACYRCQKEYSDSEKENGVLIKFHRCEKSNYREMLCKKFLRGVGNFFLTKNQNLKVFGKS